MLAVYHPMYYRWNPIQMVYRLLTLQSPHSIIYTKCVLKTGGEMRASECFKWREGVVWPSVRWAAAWCLVPGGSDLILPADAWLNNEVRSHQINDKKQR